MTTFVKSTRPHSPEEAETWREQTVAPTLNGHDHRYQGEATPSVLLTASTAASPARTSAWPASGAVYPASAAVCGLSSNASCARCGLAGASSKTSLDSSPQTEEETLDSFSGRWLSAGMAWRGGLWTRNSSERPSVVVESCLSDVLETTPPPVRYWLSARAAMGILRRAENRKKTLPTRLLEALQKLAGVSPTPGTPPTSLRQAQQNFETAWARWRSEATTRGARST